MRTDDAQIGRAIMAIQDEDMRAGVRLLKDAFLRWREPPVELPPDSVIEAIVLRLMQHGAIRAVESLIQ